MDATVFVESIGVAAPGLPDWPTTARLLADGAAYEPVEMVRFAPTFLPANERRRATTVGRLAFQSAEEAVRGRDGALADLGSVFATSGGDTEVLDRLCTVLASADRAISPTDFHNSVHNAPAGYWSIATRSRLPCTALSAFDSTFAAGLLEAISTATQENIPMLLVAYDMRPPAMLHPARPLLAHFSSALWLSPQQSGDSIAALAVENVGLNEPPTRMTDTGLEELRLGNPAARALPLLAALAKRQRTRVGLPYFERSITVSVEPCS
jgi:hypothetical protein